MGNYHRNTELADLEATLQTRAFMNWSSPICSPR